MKNLKGSRALVTGASSGIGRDISRELARRGADLILVARSAERLGELEKEIAAAAGVAVRTVSLDLSRPDAPEALFRKVSALGLAVDILVNNAGYGIHRLFADIPWDEEGAMIRLLVDNPAHTTKLFLQPMIARGRGYILHTSSTGAFQPTPTYATYAASKSFVMSFSIALRHELRGSGVSSSVLCPGVTYTGFQKAAGHERQGAFMKMTGMESPKVARIAVQGMLGGKALIIPGFSNKLSAMMTRLISRNAAASVAASAMGKPEK